MSSKWNVSKCLCVQASDICLSSVCVDSRDHHIRQTTVLWTWDFSLFSNGKKSSKVSFASVMCLYFHSNTCLTETWTRTLSTCDIKLRDTVIGSITGIEGSEDFERMTWIIRAAESVVWSAFVFQLKKEMKSHEGENFPVMLCLCYQYSHIYVWCMMFIQQEMTSPDRTHNYRNTADGETHQNKIIKTSSNHDHNYNAWQNSLGNSSLITSFTWWPIRFKNVFFYLVNNKPWTAKKKWFPF